MGDWLHNLPVIWMAVVIFGVTYLATAAIYAVVMALATGERARAFKAVSPGMLPPLGDPIRPFRRIHGRPSLER